MKMFFASLLLASLTSCAANPETKTEAKRLATYEVPAGFAQELTDTMITIFNATRNRDEGLEASVHILPNGHVAVYASEGVHQGFAEMVRDLQNKTPPPGKNARVNCWVVLSEEGGRASDPRLNPLSEVLSQLRTTGNERFMLLEKLELTQILGNTGRARGAYFSIETTLAENAPNQLLLDFELESRISKHSLQTKLVMKPDEYVVLAKGHYNPKMAAVELDLEADSQAQLYYILSAQTL